MRIWAVEGMQPIHRLYEGHFYYASLWRVHARGIDGRVKRLQTEEGSRVRFTRGRESRNSPDFEKPSSPCVTSTCMHEGHVLDSSCRCGMQDHRFEGSNVPILLVSLTPPLPRCMVCNGSSMRCGVPRPPHLLPPSTPWTPPTRTWVQLPPSLPPSPPPREGASASWVHLPRSGPGAFSTVPFSSVRWRRRG